MEEEMRRLAAILEARDLKVPRKKGLWLCDQGTPGGHVTQARDSAALSKAEHQTNSPMVAAKLAELASETADLLL